jgi:4-hydroxybenzoate polyprenyltransferase
MIEKALGYLISASVFLSLNGMFAALFSSILYSINIRLEVLLVAFLFTFSIYNLNRVTDKAEDLLNRPSTAKNSRYYLFFSVVALVLCFGVAVTLGIESVVVLIIPLFVGVSYSVRLMKTMPRLKDFVGVKSIVVAFSWAFTSSLLPIVSYNIALEKVFVIFIYIFVQLFVNTVIFDVLDMKGDGRVGLKTIPIVLGVKKTAKLLFSMNTLIIGLLVYCVFCSLFLEYLPALIFGLVFGYVYVFLFCRAGCKRLRVEFTVDGQWIPIVAFMQLI